MQRQVVSREDWLAARRQLLTKEKDQASELPPGARRQGVTKLGGTEEVHS
jgi:predicted dithiol-disulfide oxidoreductase (DUF899 family)